MSRVIHSLLATSAIAATGCGPEPLPTLDHTDLTTVRVGTVTSTAAAGFELKGTLERGSGVALDDHHIALLDREARQVVIVDTNGQTRFRLGKQGWDEGQFMSPAFAIRTDSGVAVFDALRTVMVRFDNRGRQKKDTPQFDALGIPTWGGFTGMAQLSDGSWVYSVTGTTDAGHLEALFRRTEGSTHLIATTPPGPVPPLRFECGARLIAGSRVFWPTLRWATNGHQVVYAATADDRVATWDVSTGDSTVILGQGPSRRSSEESALAVTEPLTIQTLSQRCEMTKEDVVKQRGMTERMPAIRSVAIAPDGTVWVAMTTLPPEPSFIRVHGTIATDTIVGGTFPDAFLTPTRFLAEQTDTTGQTAITIWELRHRP